MGKKVDATGKIYGNLKAIRNTGEKYKGTYIWEFECLLCGKHVKKRLSQVKSGQITSCGCQKEKNLKTMDIKTKLGQVDGTNVSRIMSGKIQKNNSAGHKGVSLQRQKGRQHSYVAYIYFKGKRYHLGSYHKIEDAIAARESAEKEMYNNFCEWYAEQFPERWKKMNKEK